MPIFTKPQPVVETDDFTVEETAVNGEKNSMTWYGKNCSASASKRTSGEWKVLVHVLNKEVAKYRSHEVPTTEEVRSEIEFALRQMGFVQQD